MPPIPLVGPSSTVASWSLDKARAVNIFAEILESPKGKSIAMLRGTPGLRLFSTLPNLGGCRGLYTTMSGAGVYAVQGDGLYQLFEDGTYTLRGTLLSSNGPVSMADNNTQLQIVTGAFGYIHPLGSTTLTQITDADFLGSTKTAYLDGYFVNNRPLTNQFYWSALHDGLTYDGLDFASVEGSTDLLLGHLVDHRELWLFGDRTTEVWYNSGSEATFERFGGAFIEQGCAAIWTAAKLDNSVFWVSRNEYGHGMVVRADGYQPMRVSTHSVELDLGALTIPQLNALTAWTYQQEGHSFYCLNLPQTTWVFDASTGLWHERCYYSAVTGQFTRHRAEWHTDAYGKHLVGDSQDGRIYALDLDYYKDDQDELISERIFPYVTGEGVRVRHHGLEVECEVGVGLDGGVEPGTTPQMMLQWSDTDGKTWSNEHWQSMGKLGQYRTRVNWSRLGQAWHRLYKLRISDPVKRAIITAYLDASGGRA